MMAAGAVAAMAPAMAMAQAPDPVDKLFAAYKADTPGCAVGVERPGAPPLYRAYGSADLEHPAPITPDTIFEAGSVSKQFTAAAVLVLADQGKVRLDADIRTYFPEMPDYGRPITVNDLLSHTSGLRDWGEVEGMAGWPRSERAYVMSDVLRIAARQKQLNHAPGAHWSYTNTGYNLLAMLVERVSGQSFEAFSREHVFLPTGMAHTRWRDNFRDVVPGRAIAYSHEKTGYEQDMPFESIFGNGGLLTTVGDLLAWNRALSEGKLGAFVTTELQRPAHLSNGRALNYARGLMVQDHHGVREVSHSGATGGYRAWLGRFPDQGVSVAVLCSAAEANPSVYGYGVADLYLPPKPAGEASPATGLAAHAGLYVDDRAGDTFKLVADGQTLKDSRGPVIKAAADGKLTLGGGPIRFLPDGRVEREILGDLILYRPVAAAAPTAAELAQAVGRYRSDETEATYELKLDGSKLRLTIEQRPSDSFLLEPTYRDAFTADDQDVRLIRDRAGKVTAISVSGSRVWDMRFRRVG